MKTLIAHPEFEYLADELVMRNPETIRKWDVKFLKFPDGTPAFELPNVKTDIEHQDVTYIADFSQPETLFENYNLLFNLVKNTASKVRIIMPFFPMGTSERVEKKWKTETAHAYGHMISSLPSGWSAKNSIHIFDIHALVEQSLFNVDRINAQLHTTTSLLDIPEGSAVVFPDDGAAKRFKENFSESVDKIICIKVRGAWEKREITLKEWDPRDKDVILVDDLIQTGGTLREAARMLRDKWARSVRAFAPHGVFPGGSHIALASELDELIVTDTIPANIDRANAVNNMRVISIAPLVEKILLRHKE